MTELRCDIYTVDTLKWASDRTFFAGRLPEGSKGIGNTGNLDIAGEEVKIAWNVMLPVRDKVCKS